MNDLDRIWSASLDQLKAGYVEADEHYTCLCCGRQFEKGIIYPEEGVLYEAGRYTRLHIEQEHQSVLAYLLGLDKSVTGLSELQRKLVWLFYQGKSDAEVQRELGMGSTSTIRNHRFLLREKVRQAKVFQAIMELLPARDQGAPPMPGSKDGRRQTVDPQDKVLKKYFPHGTEGPLATLSMPEQQRLIVLGLVAQRFHTGRIYTEAEVNQILEAVFEDHVLLRRYLVDTGLLKRLPDGSQYWRNDATGEGQGGKVDRRKELKRLAKETRADAGVYRIANTRNGKAFIEGTPDLKTMNGQRFQLEMGSHPIKELQREWNEFGPDAFTFEVLERPETGPFDLRDALKKLKEMWLDRLQPFGERGYNPIRRQR